MKTTCSFVVSIMQDGKTLASDITGTAFDSLFAAFAKVKPGVFEFDIARHGSPSGFLDMLLPAYRGREVTGLTFVGQVDAEGEVTPFNFAKVYATKQGIPEVVRMSCDSREVAEMVTGVQYISSVVKANHPSHRTLSEGIDAARKLLGHYTVNGVQCVYTDGRFFNGKTLTLKNPENLPAVLERVEHNRKVVNAKILAFIEKPKAKVTA